MWLSLENNSIYTALYSINISKIRFELEKIILQIISNSNQVYFSYRDSNETKGNKQYITSNSLFI